MSQPVFVVDAFTARRFGGNPAAVVPVVGAWPSDKAMQDIAAEFNLSETAFCLKDEGGWRLRWFTPTVEVDLCGHATLATAWVVFNKLEPGLDTVAFETRSGLLSVRRDADLLWLDFPARAPTPCASPEGLAAALGAVPRDVWKARDVLAVFDHADQIRALAPDLAALARIDAFAVIVTAPGDGSCDFVSRFFAPGRGIPEDPVTGSAHCTLVPYWSDRLGKMSLRARQLSRRGGELECRMEGARVLIAGRAVLFLEGAIVF